MAKGFKKSISVTRGGVSVSASRTPQSVLYRKSRAGSFSSGIFLEEKGVNKIIRKLSKGIKGINPALRKELIKLSEKVKDDSVEITPEWSPELSGNPPQGHIDLNLKNSAFIAYRAGNNRIVVKKNKKRIWREDRDYLNAARGAVRRGERKGYPTVRIGYSAEYFPIVHERYDLRHVAPGQAGFLAKAMQANMWNFRGYLKAFGKKYMNSVADGGKIRSRGVNISILMEKLSKQPRGTT